MRKQIAIAAMATIFIFGPIVFAEMPSPEPEVLWKYITEENPYTNWGFWPDHQGMQPGRAPHGPLHKVYVNDRALNSARPPLQYGSILVKENYSKDEKLGAVTVMYKINAYNPEEGDWFWVKYSSDGKVDKFGKPKGWI